MPSRKGQRAGQEKTLKLPSQDMEQATVDRNNAGSEARNPLQPNSLNRHNKALDTPRAIRQKAPNGDNKGTHKGDEWDEDLRDLGVMRKAETPQEVTMPDARIAGSEQGKRDSDEVWRQRRSKDGAEQGALSEFVYCRDQALSVSVRRALSVSVYRRDSRIE
ncbi:hypothetical protein NDU88_005051 [Pleurodeles waltl]|uniref:Uncharacterized protein n=1 Tax=Pleurodeles waltl TaxID=8319 RepID=A0AAV7RL77_PLEWA|nr:hypothetical protein NDU88_005051 [Pleurodeles waltl]